MKHGRRGVSSGFVLLILLMSFTPSSYAIYNLGPIISRGAVSAVAQNFALASKGGTVSGSSTYTSSPGYLAQAANDGDRAGNNWGSGGGWEDATSGNFPDYIEVHFASSVSVSEVDVFSVQDLYSSPANPTSAMTFTLYGLTDFKVQYEVGGAWIDVPTANITGNNLVWRKFTFAPVTASKIRLAITGAVDGKSRLTEIEAWGIAAGPLPVETRTNVALAANGASATASSSEATGNYTAAGAINGDRNGNSWGNNGGWNDGTPSAFPDWLEIDFSGSKTIGEIDLFSVQDTYMNPQVPIDSMTFTKYGLTDFEIQYWDGSAWTAIPGGSVTGNSFIWRKFTFSSITTSKIRIYITATTDNVYSRITEVEAWTP